MKTATRSAAAVRAPLPCRYQKWFCATIVAGTGSSAFSVALQWAATAHGGGIAGVVLACGVLPQMILLLIGGAVADRLGPRRIMTITLVTMVATSLSLAVVAALVGGTARVLIAFSTISGAINAFYLPASTSMVRRLVEEDQLARAHATQQAGQRTAAFAGAALGGALAAAGNLEGAAAINAVACGVVIVALKVVRPAFTPPTHEERTSIGRDVRDGIRLAARDPLLRPSLLVMAAAAAFFAPVAPLLVPLLVREHGWDATAVGWFLAVESVAFFLVAIVVSRRGALSRRGLTSVVGVVAMGMGVVIVARSPDLAFGLAGACAAGVGYGLAATHLTPLVINASPQSHLSRTTAAMTISQNLTVITMFALSGGLAEAVGPATISLIDGILLITVGLTALTSRTFRRA